MLDNIPDRVSNALQRLQQARVVIADSQLDSNPEDDYPQTGVQDDSVDFIPALLIGAGVYRSPL
jgi:hypothetical protein